jgi:hypothetical protein
LLVARLLFLYGYLRPICEQMEDVYRDLDQAELGDDFRVTHESHFDFEDQFQRGPLSASPLSRLPTHSPLNRLPYYLNIAERTYAPIFSTGLIEDKGPSQALDSVTSIANMSHYPGCLVILGSNEGNHFIAKLLGDHYRVLLDRDYVVVMKLDRLPHPPSAFGDTP